MDIRSFTFQPATLAVARGDTVVWTNHDVVPHTATVQGGRGWDSGGIDAQKSWRLVAGQADSVSYYCVFHPNMKGTLVVR